VRGIDKQHLTQDRRDPLFQARVQFHVHVTNLEWIASSDIKRPEESHSLPILTRIRIDQADIHPIKHGEVASSSVKKTVLFYTAYPSSVAQRDERKAIH
jgi:hypothetical protein